MIRAFAIALVLTLGSTVAFAADDDDDDDEVPEADMAKVTAALADLGCKDPEGVKKEQEGIYEIDDAQCKMRTMDIKLDKDFSVHSHLALLSRNSQTWFDIARGGPA